MNKRLFFIKIVIQKLHLTRFHINFDIRVLYILQGPEKNTAEVACQSNLGSSITTGGGISAGYALPSWQASVVNAYFTSVAGTSKAPAAGYPTSTATSGRGYPDISALAKNYVVIGNNQALGG